MSKPKQYLQTVSESVLSFEKDTADKIFTLIQLGFVIGILALTLRIEGSARQLPMVVLVPTGVLLIVLLVFQQFPALPERFGISSASDSFSMESLVNDGSEGDGSSERVLEKRKRTLVILFWMVGAFVAIVSLGFIDGFLIYLLGMYYFWAETSVLKTVVYSLVVWGFLVLLFDFVLSVPFPRGSINIFSTLI